MSTKKEPDRTKTSKIKIWAKSIPRKQSIYIYPKSSVKKDFHRS